MYYSCLTSKSAEDGAKVAGKVPANDLGKQKSKKFPLWRKGNLLKYVRWKIIVQWHWFKNFNASSSHGSDYDLNI